MWALEDTEVAGTPTLLLDLSALVSATGEGGLLSVAFHPKWKTNRQLFVSYTTPGPFRTVIARYNATAGAPDTYELATGLVILEQTQPFTNHNGGQIAFDASGKLLVGLGDGGSAGDPLLAGQDGQTLLGKLLRLDVDKPSGGKAYGIPEDNPFVAPNSGLLPEIWALGLRNPWRFSVDAVDGQIWLADVGQGQWEEVDLIQKGGNYGWNVMEGNHCYSPSTGCDQTGLTLPIAEYNHSLGTSITGGFVYRGKQFPSLFGAYLFADYGSGRIWKLVNDDGSWVMTEIAQVASGIVSFGYNRDGELYVLRLFGSTVERLVVAETAPTGKAFPLLLSQTECFFSLSPLTPGLGLIPYEVNAPLWSDGADKDRWLVLPQGATPTAGLPGPVTASDEPSSSWDVPVGTVVWKHFRFGTVPIETRAMVRASNGWQFHSWRWNADGTDATWIPGGGGSQTFAIPTGPTTVNKTWTYPTTGQCQTCHQGPTVRDQLLGVQTAQLNRPASWAGGLPQLGIFSSTGLLATALDPASSPALADVTGLTATNIPKQPEPAARAYLHGNCSNCHRPGGSALPGVDLRSHVAFSATGTCLTVPQAGTVSGAASHIVKPGAPSKSALWLRMNQSPTSQWLMPPVGVSTIDKGGVNLLFDWIASLKTCQP
jgi:glucose/arabinose dehydrogenase